MRWTLTDDMQVAGVQVPGPQTLAIPVPPQDSVPAQVPQVSVPPQPSETVPQFFCSVAQVAGRQVFCVAHAPSEQVWPRPQVLHALPNWPQALVAEPPWHWPVASQQPVQLVGPH